MERTTRSPSAASAPVSRTVVLAAVFLSGAVLLGVEMTASRVLAPYFGNSLFVWGAIIGVILTGLSIGYWLGGIAGDRLPSPLLLVATIAAGGVAVGLVQLVDTAVIEAVLAWDPGPRADPLLCALVLFFPLSVILSAVGPIAVRLQAQSVEQAGTTAGRTFAISTAGSIFGTFVTSFWLVTAIGTTQVFVLGAAVLLATAALVAAAARSVPWAAGTAAAAVLAGVAVLALGSDHVGPLSEAASRNWSPLFRERGYGYVDPRDPASVVEDPSLRVVHAEDTRYHRLAIVEDQESRYLRFDNSVQSAMYIGQPFRTRFRYTDFFHLGLVYNEGARNVLHIGLGAGSSQKRMVREFPRVRLTSVELDPAVVEAAHRWFAVPRDHPRLRVEVGDGRRYLATNDTLWDVIVVDAFFADAVPAHLVTQEFLTLARSRLAPGGVVVTNAIGALAGPQSRLFRSIYKTYRSAFPTVELHPAILDGDRGDETFRNLILVSTEKAVPQPGTLVERWDAIRAESPLAPDLRKPILDRHDRAVPVDDVPVLTDDYAPTDALLILSQ
jgi:spermidine synthase